MMAAADNNSAKEVNNHPPTNFFNNCGLGKPFIHTALNTIYEHPKRKTPVSNKIATSPSKTSTKTLKFGETTTTYKRHTTGQSTSNQVMNSPLVSKRSPSYIPSTRKLVNSSGNNEVSMTQRKETFPTQKITISAHTYRKTNNTARTKVFTHLNSKSNKDGSISPTKNNLSIPQPLNKFGTIPNKIATNTTVNKKLVTMPVPKVGSIITTNKDKDVNQRKVKLYSSPKNEMALKTEKTKELCQKASYIILKDKTQTVNRIPDIKFAKRSFQSPRTTSASINYKRRPIKGSCSDVFHRLQNNKNSFTAKDSKFSRKNTECTKSVYSTTQPPTPAHRYNNTLTDRQLQVFIDKACSSGKFKQLKTMIQEAILRKKVFTVYGRSCIIRNELKKRGWVEKLSNNMIAFLKKDLPANEGSEKFDSNIQKIIISKMLQKYPSNFIWMLRNNFKILNSSNLTHNPLINRLKMEDNCFTTKEGLCTSLKNKYWFHIDGVSEVNTPRSYNVFDNDEIEEFTADYRITACTSLLQWFVKHTKENQKSIVSKDGKINLTIIFFALKRCQSYILCKEHRDIDKKLRDPKQIDWINFLDNYNRLITYRDCFREENANSFKMYVNCSDIVLRYMKKYRPQIECEGYYNIWIVKPAHWARGKGITLANDIKKILNISTQPGVKKYVVQKYIEMPLLIYDTKFDIRQYYIVTSTYPLVIWMYRNCYLRFSSQKYCLHNFHESIHLTNNAVQHRYKNCSERHSDLPKNNMWSLQQFKQYLSKNEKSNLWDNIIYPGMRRNIIGAMLSCQDGMINRKNNFELYGCDFVLDNKYRPWLIEINSCPDMSASTNVTAKICPEALQDLIKVVIDYKHNYLAPTGHFECIYHQKMTTPVICTDTSALALHGEPVRNGYFFKGHDVNEPQYEEAGIELINNDSPIKYVLERLESDSLLHEIPSVGETMVHQYRSSTTTVLSMKNDDLASTPGNSASAINMHNSISRMEISLHNDNDANDDLENKKIQQTSDLKNKNAKDDKLNNFSLKETKDDITQLNVLKTDDTKRENLEADSIKSEILNNDPSNDQANGNKGDIAKELKSTVFNDMEKNSPFTSVTIIDMNEKLDYLKRKLTVNENMMVKFLEQEDKKKSLKLNHSFQNFQVSTKKMRQTKSFLDTSSKEFISSLQVKPLQESYLYEECTSATDINEILPKQEKKKFASTVARKFVNFSKFMKKNIKKK